MRTLTDVQSIVFGVLSVEKRDGSLGGEAFQRWIVKTKDIGQGQHSTVAMITSDGPRHA